MSTLARSFPDDVVLHDQEQRVPARGIDNETRWVPGEQLQGGKFQRWARFMLLPGNDGEVARQQELAALPVQIQQCIADLRRGLFARWSGGHGQTVKFTMQGPVGPGGTDASVDVVSQRAAPGVVLWAPGNPRPEQERVLTTLPKGTALTQLQNGWLAQGTRDQLLALWKAPATATPTTQTRPVTQPRPAVMTPDMSLAAGLEVMGQNLHLLDTRPRPGVEQQFEARIDAAVSAFLEFGQLFCSKVDAMPQDTYPRQALGRSLHLPFQIVANNHANPMRNGAVAARLARDQGIPPEVFLLAQQQPHHFAYEDLPIEVVAAFAPTRRSMILPPDLNPQNPMFKWVKLHELYHVYQFAEHRRRMGLENFLRFMSAEGKPSFLVDEVQAYGYELEGMNLELDDELRQIARAGQTLDGDRMRQRLGGIDERYRVAMQFLAHIGTLYFRDGKEDGVYPNAYVQSVLQCLIHDGYTPYQFNAAGQPEKILMQ